MKLLKNLKPGKVYHRRELALLSPSMDRVLKILESESLLKKVGPGLFYYPKKMKFGVLPPNEKTLLSKFLKTNDLLLLSPNWYNSLGLGLSQLSTTVKVYNNKRYETLILAGQQYAFIRPNNGFPKKLSKEFLLIDLLNNLDEVGEDENKLKNKITKKINEYNSQFLFKLSEKYGKVSTKKFFREVLHVGLYSSAA